MGNLHWRGRQEDSVLGEKRMKQGRAHSLSFRGLFAELQKRILG